MSTFIKITPTQQLKEMKKKTPLGLKLLEAEKKLMNYINRSNVAFLSDGFIIEQFSQKVKRKEEPTIWRMVKNES